MSMRLRLILSFFLVVLVAVASVVILVRTDSASQVKTYMLRGGMIGVENLVTTLENYYAENGSWQGVEPLFSSPTHMGGRGPNSMMQQRLRLADDSGAVVADTTGTPIGTLTPEERVAAMHL